MKEIKVGFLGLGTVGQGVWDQLIRKAPIWEERFGAKLTPVVAAVKNIDKKRDIELSADQLTLDTESIVNNPDIDLVIELMGGTEQAKALTETAFKNGKSVISANKALICEHGHSLLESMQANGVEYHFEASVGGGIPIIKAVREAFVGNKISSIMGILNGTSNYMLTRMQRAGLNYPDALKEAQDLGYVEQDESLDLDGIDAAHKLLILVYLCYNQWFSLDDIHVEGIREVSKQDIQAAKQLGYKIKLLANFSVDEANRQLAISVRPTLISKTNNLANVDDVYNGVKVDGDIVGSSYLIGKGAGRDATTSAVLSDVADYIRSKSHRMAPSSGIPSNQPVDSYSLATPDLVSQAYYIRFEVEDVKGVLSAITQKLSDCDISISTIKQTIKGEGSATIILTTHESKEIDVNHAIEAINTHTFMRQAPVIFPILKD